MQTLSTGETDAAPAPTPMPLSELAPPPSAEDLFGKTEIVYLLNIL